MKDDSLPSLETQQDDSLPSEKKLCNVQASIEELGDNKKEIVTDGEVFCDAQCGFIEFVNNETDPVSDEEEFWDAQRSFKGYDDSTYDLNHALLGCKTVRGIIKPIYNLNFSCL